MATRNKSQEALGIRLADMLTRLNNGETLDIQSLPSQYNISLRTAQRDINRLSNILDVHNNRFYSLNKNKHGYLSKDEIQRFCRFLSVQELFPESDRRFFQEQLRQSIQIKGFQYEDITNRKDEFDLITQAINNHQQISFDYSKVKEKQSKNYQIHPYRLVNKNGIWYLIGIDKHQPKTFCFTQISNLHKLNETFEIDENLLQQINETDSIYHGNHLNEIIIKINAHAAGYFKRRPLLPNQETIRELEDGTLLLACKNINSMEIIPIVQYWIPHVHIVSPIELQEKMVNVLKDYINN